MLVLALAVGLCSVVSFSKKDWWSGDNSQDSTVCRSDKPYKYPGIEESLTPENLHLASIINKVPDETHYVAHHGNYILFYSIA